MPWENWEFNREFFKSLSKYRKAHPETSISRILGNICQTVENGKDLFEAIPDGPLPLRGFVKALACLLKLGVVSQMGHSTAVCSINNSSSHHISRWLEGQETVFMSFPNKLPRG